MNRQELIEKIASGADISKKAAQEALDSFLKATKGEFENSNVARRNKSDRKRDRKYSIPK